ncbi:MAG: hypothetical protein HPY66_2736 [Firmicutes bacterium]|nr:hypothetical protein [Bacillota bacterium]MDI6706105.1 DUF3298 and DUF4163 domain-containing protein [Bacillota bacterium]
MNGIQLPVSIRTMRLFWPNLIVYYPEVYGMADTVVQQKINTEILKQVDRLIRDQGYYQNPMTQITGYYEIKTNERNILSLALINYAFSGGAHGLTIMRSLTFDVVSGKSYQLKELFKKDSDYVKVLSEIVGVQIKERDLPLLEEYNGIKPDQDYYIADKCLVLYYQLYELVPYAYGFPYFPISVYEIQDIIDEDGPLGRMIW